MILIIADVRAHEPGRLEWLLHYKGTAQQHGSARALSNEEAEVTVHSLFPEDAQFFQKMGLKDHDPDTQVPYLAIVPEGSRREAKFITAVIPEPKGTDNSVPRIESLKSENAIGVRIHNAQTVTDVWLNLMADGRRMHRNSNHVIDDWDTDAYLIGLTRPIDTADTGPDSLIRCFIACGSYLRKDGKVALQSLSKVYTVFKWQDQELHVALQGQPLMRADLRAVAEPSMVRLNDTPTDFVYDTEKQTLRLQLHNASEAMHSTR